MKRVALLVLALLCWALPAPAQTLTCDLCVWPDNTWLTAVSHTNSSNVVRVIGLSSAGLPGANALYLGWGTAAPGLDATRYVELDASERLDFRVLTRNYGMFWGPPHIPMFGLSIARQQWINTITTNVLLLHEATTGVDVVSKAFIIRAAGATASNSGRSGALVLEAGPVSNTGAGSTVANDVRINAGNRGNAIWGNVVLNEYTVATDDNTDVPAVPTNGMKGGLVLHDATAAPSAPLADHVLLYPDPATHKLMICQPGETTCRAL